MRIPPIPGPRDLLGLVERGGEQIEALLGAVPRILALLTQVEELTERVTSLVERIEGTRVAADGVVRRTEGTRARADELLEAVGPPLIALQPTLERLAETTDPREVDAMVELIDLLPRLATQVQQDLMPVLSTLGTVAPDLHDLLDVSRELNEMLAKLPGMGRIKRRVEEQQAADGA